MRPSNRTNWSLVVGQGPIGLMFTMLVNRAGATRCGDRYHAFAPGPGARMRRRISLEPARDRRCAEVRELTVAAAPTW